jgi:hypothetical protein
LPLGTRMVMAGLTISEEKAVFVVAVNNPRRDGPHRVDSALARESWCAAPTGPRRPVPGVDARHLLADEVHGSISQVMIAA